MYRIIPDQATHVVGLDGSLVPGIKEENMMMGNIITIQSHIEYKSRCILMYCQPLSKLSCSSSNSIKASREVVCRGRSPMPQ